MTDNIRTNFCATCKEQADRIEALTAEKDKLGNLLLETAARNAREIVRLEVENERLRAALKDLLEDTQHENHNCIEEDCPVKAARAALGESHDQ